MTRLLHSTLIIFSLTILACTVYAQRATVGGMVATCDEPEFPGSYLITENTATLTWALPPAFPNASFEVELIETGMPFSGVANYTGIVAPPLAISNLLPGKTYKFRVRTICTGGLVSGWSIESRFRTVLTNPQCGLSLALADTSCAPETNHFRIRASQVPGTALGTDVTLRAVRLIMSHTWASDMAISLVSPSGVRVLLIDSLQTGGNHFGDIGSNTCGNYLELSSQCASLSIRSAQSPFIGTYFPLQPLSLFHDGSNPNGIWTLEACDRFANDRGTLHYLELVFEPVACTVPAPAVVTNISLTGAQVVIPAGMGCDSVVVEYGPRGFRPGNQRQPGPQGTVRVIGCAGGMVALSQLQPFTDYSIYLRKRCTGGVYSPNSCASVFYTDCSFPSEEENFNSQPNCALVCAVPCAISGDWQNSTNDHFDWTTTSFATPTAATGPDTDFEGGGKYAYIEVTGAACGLTRTAILESHCLQVVDQPADCDMGFAYHMFGSQTGTLKVEASNNGGITWTVLWSKTGNQGNQWFRQKLDLAAYHNQTILLRFAATSANGSAGDIAIDNVRFFGSTFLNHGANTFYRDADQDGFGNENIILRTCDSNPPTGYVATSGDCDDTRANVYPGATEIPCNGIDDNCNGMQDDNIISAPIISGATGCIGAVVSLSAQQMPSGTLYWYRNGALIGTGNPFSFIVPSANTTLVVKDSISGCAGVFDTVQIAPLPTPQLSISQNIESCQGKPIDLTRLPIIDHGNSGASFSYYPNANLFASQQFPNGPVVPSGTTTYYALAVTAQNCRDTLALPIIVYNNPNASILQGDTLRLCRGAQAVLSATAVGSPFQPFAYSWSNGLNFAQIPIIAPATQQAYTVTVTDTKGCSATDTIRVVTKSSITQTAVIQIQPVSQCGINDGRITLQPVDGVPPYQFSWSGAGGSGTLTNVQSIGTITGLASGGYRVTVTDSSPGGGCGMVMPLIVVDAPNFRIDSVKLTRPTCYGLNNGRISLEVTAQFPVINWSNGSVGPQISNLPAGVYSATVTDGGCQQIINQIVLTQPDSIRIATNSITPVRCFGQNNGAIDLFVSGGTGSYQYLWSHGPTTQDVTQLTQGTYTVMVRDSLLCTKAMSLHVSEPAQLQVLVDSIFHPKCNGDSTGYLRVKLAGGIAPYSFTWDNQATSLTRTNLPGGAYSITVTDLQQCTASRVQNISPPPPLSASVLFAQNPQCIGVQNGRIFVEVTGGVQPYLVKWSDTGATGSVFRQNLGPGIYRSTITDAHGCTDTIAAQTLSAPQLVPVQSILKTDIACHGGQSGAIQVQATNSHQLSYFLNGNVSAATMNNLSAGNYVVEVKNGQGCIYSDTITLTQPAAALTTTLLDVEQPLCAGISSGSISVQTLGGTPPYSFHWNSGQTSESLQNLRAGTYTLTATDANLCTAQLPPVTIREPLPLASAVMKTDIPCFGATSGSIVLQTQGGVPPYRYAWSSSDTSSAIFNLAPGQYDVTIIDHQSCILELKTIEIADLREDFDVTVVRTQNAVCNNENNGQIIVRVNQSTGPYAFNWSQPIGLRQRNIPVDTLSDLMPGSYQVTVTNGSGCVASSPVIEVFNPPILQVSANLEPVRCKGTATGKIEMQVLGGVPPYNYTWSDQGANSATRTQLPAGSYRLTLTDFNACQMQLGPYEITEPATGIRVMLDTINGGLTDDKCSTCKGSIQIYVDGGQGGYRYLWNDNITEQDRTNLCAGVYSLTVTDQSNCTKQSGLFEVKALSDPPGFEAVRIVDVACKGDSTGAIYTSVAGGTAPYQVFWTSNQTGDTLTNLPAGLYLATIIDAAQCTGYFGVLVKEPDTALSIEGTVVRPSWNQQNGSITLNIYGGNPGYQVKWSANAGGQTGPAIQQLAAGVYSATITDAGGCTATYTVDITSSTIDLSPETYQLAPNPVSTLLRVFSVSPSANITPVQYQIMDALGRVVVTGKLSDMSLEIPVHHLADGHYQLLILSDHGRWLGRFVKHGE